MHATASSFGHHHPPTHPSSHASSVSQSAAAGAPLTTNINTTSNTNTNSATAGYSSIHAHMESYLSSLIHDTFFGTTPELHEFLTIQPARALYPGDDAIVFEDGIHYSEMEPSQPASSLFVDAPEASAALLELAEIAASVGPVAAAASSLSNSLKVSSAAMISMYEESERKDHHHNQHYNQHRSTTESRGSTGRRHSSRKSVEDYQLVRVLGKGCMGKVLLAQDKTSSRLFAIKAISKHWVASHGPQEIEHTRAEQRILAELSRTNNPFLIKLHCSFQNHENLFLVLDYVGGGDLATQLAKWHRFCLTRSRFYCAEMVQGIRELHRLGVIYR